MRTLGVDPGDARVGLAVSDDEGVWASPLCTIAARGEGDPAVRIAQEAVRAGCGQIVIGLPRNLDGSEGGAARKARLLAARVHTATGLRVVLWDERLTTAEASRVLSAVEMRARDQRAVIDQVAATILLQSFLDARAARRRAKREAAARGAVAAGRSASSDATEAEWSAKTEDAASAPDAAGAPDGSRAPDAANEADAARAPRAANAANAPDAARAPRAANGPPAAVVPPSAPPAHLGGRVRPPRDAP